MEIKDYWWEDEFYRLLVEYHEENIGMSDLVLFIVKVIEAEKYGEVEDRPKEIPE